MQQQSKQGQRGRNQNAAEVSPNGHREIVRGQPETMPPENLTVKRKPAKTKAERKGKDVMDAIGRKYKSKKLLGVADLADLEGEKIKKMIEMANI